MLRLAASLEAGTEQPLAAAIVGAARERGLEPARSTGFEAVTGKGVRGSVDGTDAALGKPPPDD